MKRWTLSLLVSLLLLSVCQAQFKKGDLELAFSGTLGIVKETYQSDSETRQFAVLTIAPGIFISDGVSIEPELGFFAYEEIAPAQSIVANLSYTKLPDGKKLAIFVRGGYGLSNSIPFPVPGGILIRGSDKFDIQVLNVGGGIKYLIAPNAVLRVEFNYRKYSWSEEVPFLQTGEIDYTFSNTGLLLGFSVLL